MNAIVVTQVPGRAARAADFKPLFELWYQNYTTRLQLRKLTSAELNDVAITHAAARKESCKPFWQR